MISDSDFEFNVSFVINASGNDLSSARRQAMILTKIYCW